MASMILSMALAGAIFIVLIGLTFLASKRPLLLSPFRKLGVSALLIVAAFAVALLIPDIPSLLAPLRPVIAVPLFALVVLPEGFVGALFALFLVLRGDSRWSYNVNVVWWCVTLLPAIWSATAILAWGEIDNWWN